MKIREKRSALGAALAVLVAILVAVLVALALSLAPHARHEWELTHVEVKSAPTTRARPWAFVSALGRVDGSRAALLPLLCEGAALEELLRAQHAQEVALLGDL